MPPPPINKALLRDYENPLVSLNKALLEHLGILIFLPFDMQSIQLSNPPEGVLVRKDVLLEGS